jgi:hypothetical protein
MVVVDADRKPNGPDGVAAFHALCAERSIDLSGAFVVETPSGGLHFYWRTETPYSNSRGSLPDGIDVRGKGGYVIAPGATLPDGRSYRIVHGSWDAIPVLPGALAGLLREKGPVTTPAPPGAPVGANVTDRDLSFGCGALAKAHEAICSAGKGERNNACFIQLAALYELVANGSIQEQALIDMAFDAMEKNGYIADDGKEALWKTIQSAKERGIIKPRPLLALAPNVASIDVSALIPKTEKEWPTTLNADAYIGIAGDFIRLVAPQTEGDPCALLIAFLTVVGSLIGRGAYLPIGPTHHFGNLFSVIVADTSKGRKGTVMAEARRFATMIDPTIATRMLGGLSSGEGLIEAVRDARHDETPIEQGRISIIRRLLFIVIDSPQVKGSSWASRSLATGSRRCTYVGSQTTQLRCVVRASHNDWRP